MVSSVETQAEKYGFEFPQQLAKAIYPFIISGKVQLWNDPNKKELIQPEMLLGMEKNAKALFSASNQVFLFELWKIKNKETTIETKGFLFLYNEKNEAINFGFVEYDSLQKYIEVQSVETNAFGTSHLTFKQVFQNRLFDAKIISFNKEIVKTNITSKRIQKEYFQKNNYQKTNIDQNKKNISYEINFDSVAVQNKVIAYALNFYLDDNRLDFLNLAGDSILNYLDNQTPKIQKIIVQEKWRKTPKNIIKTPILLSFVFDNGKQLNLNSFSEINNWKLKINQKTFYETIKSKDFNYQITQINQQKISVEENEFYMDNLLNKSWDKIN